MPKSTDATDPRWFVVLDTESAVTDRSAHDRYRQIERWSPAEQTLPSRRAYKDADDPLLTPRWPFQTIAAIGAIVLAESNQGNFEVVRMDTFSSRDLDEKGILHRFFQLLSTVPRETQLVSWAGASHDLPLITVAAMRAGLALPVSFRWIARGGDNRDRHIDLKHVLSGNSKAKWVHQSELAAVCNLPAKITAKPTAVAGFIKTGDFETVEEIVEGDAITLALLFARWQSLVDGRVGHDVAEDRLLRQIEEFRPHRRYIADLRRHRGEQMRSWVSVATNGLASEAEAA